MDIKMAPHRTENCTNGLRLGPAGPRGVLLKRGELAFQSSDWWGFGGTSNWPSGPSLMLHRTEPRPSAPSLLGESHVESTAQIRFRNNLFPHLTSRLHWRACSQIVCLLVCFYDGIHFFHRGPHLCFPPVAWWSRLLSQEHWESKFQSFHFVLAPPGRNENKLFIAFLSLMDAVCHACLHVERIYAPFKISNKSNITPLDFDVFVFRQSLLC